MDPAAPCYGNSDQTQLLAQCPVKILNVQIRLDSPNVERKAGQPGGQGFRDLLQGQA